MKIQVLTKLYFPEKEGKDGKIRAKYVEAGSIIQSEDFGLSGEDIKNLTTAKAIETVKENKSKTETKK